MSATIPTIQPYNAFSTMLPVFKDAEKQALLERDGYVIIDYYTPSEMEELVSLYKTWHPTDEKGFFPSTFSKDEQYRQKADVAIQRLGQRSIQHYFENIKVVCGSFIVKAPDPDSGMGIHQDMTLVDEKRFTGINIWCPLVDLTPENGVLYALKGSHRLVPTMRGSTIPAIYDDTEVREAITFYAEPIYLKAGQAIVFDQSIIHFSPPNESNEARIVTNTFITHKEATFQIAYWDKENYGDKVEVFAQADDFMTNYAQFGHDINARPRMGKSLGFMNYTFPRLSVDQLDEIYGKYKERPKQVICTLPPEQPATSFIKRLWQRLWSR